MFTTIGCLLDVLDERDHLVNGSLLAGFKFLQLRN